MTIIKPSTAFKAGADWVSAEVRAYIKDQVATHVDTVADVRNSDFEQTRFVYVRSKAALYRLDLSSGAADDGDTVLRDNVGRRYVKVAGSTMSLLGVPQVDDLTARGAYDNEDPGFMVLVSDTGSGRAAIYTMGDGGSGDWSDPAYLTPASVGGDLSGPASSTDGNVPVFDGTTGKLVKDAGFAPADASVVSSHVSDTDNPHSVTKAQVGLSDADNTADLAKPVSVAQQDAIVRGTIAARLVPNEPRAMVLDFANQSAMIRDIYSDTANVVGRPSKIMSFARLSGGTYFDHNGVMQIAGNNVPRYDHDPVTLEPRGILVEEARTNYATYSNDLTNSVWDKVQISLGTSLSIRGFDLARLVPNTVNGSHVVRRTWSGLPANATIVVSWVVKADEYDYIALRCAPASALLGRAIFNLAEGAASSDNAGITAGLRPLGDGLLRLWAVFSLGEGVTSVRMDLEIRNSEGLLNFAGNDADGLYAGACQLEVGSFPTSYIPTTTAAATRAADQNSIPNGWSQPWFNAFNGTFCVDFVVSNLTNSARLLDRSSGNNGVLIQVQSNGAVNVQTPGSGTVSTSNGIILAGVRSKIAAAYSVAGLAVSGNGSTVVESARTPSGAVGTGGDVRLGYTTIGGPLNGHIKSLIYIPRRLSNAELQAMTS